MPPDSVTFVVCSLRQFDPNRPAAPPTPEEIQQLFSVAEKYEYWLASRDENAAIGISLR
jgi:hypothetical protein